MLLENKIINIYKRKIIPSKTDIQENRETNIFDICKELENFSPSHSLWKISQEWISIKFKKIMKDNIGYMK